MQISFCGPTEFFQVLTTNMEDVFITEDLYRPGTFQEKENRSDENARVRTTRPLVVPCNNNNNNNTPSYFS